MRHIAFREDLAEIGCSSKRGDEQYPVKNGKLVKVSKASAPPFKKGAARAGKTPTVRSVIADQYLYLSVFVNVRRVM